LSARRERGGWLARVPLVLPVAVAVLAVLLLQAGRSFSQSAELGDAAGLLGLGDARSEEEPLYVDADELQVDRERDALRAKGDVVVKRGTSVFAADRVEIDRRHGEASASGSVVLEDEQARLHADEAWLEMNDETGFMNDAEIYLADSRFQLGGTRL